MASLNKYFMRYSDSMRLFQPTLPTRYVAEKPYYGPVVVAKEDHIRYAGTTSSDGHASH